MFRAFQHFYRRQHASGTQCETCWGSTMTANTPVCTVSLPLLNPGATQETTAEHRSHNSSRKKKPREFSDAAHKDFISAPNNGIEYSLKKAKQKWKVVYTVVLYSAFLAFALCRNMYGPTLVELQIITNSDIDQISTVFTWLGAGGITGSLTYGFLYDRFAAAPLLATTLLLLGVVTCLIPVFHWIVTMMILCAIQAFLFNGISIGCNVTILHLWGKKSTSLLLGMHVLYTIGGFLVPLMSEPFMTSRQRCPVNNTHLSRTPCASTSHVRDIESRYNESVVRGNISDGLGIDRNCFSNVSALDRKPDCDSHIGYFYLIIGLYAGAAAVLNGLMYWKKSIRIGNFARSEQAPEVTRNTAVTVKVVAYILFVFLNFCFGGQEMTFSGLLFTYGTEHIGMSTIEGSLLVSALFACYGVGRICGMVVAKFITPRALLLVDFTCGSISALFLAYFSVKSPSAVWACTVVGGLALSTVFCSALIWARDFVSVGGQFTSVYVIAYTAGMMTWPPLTGFLVRERGPQWFPYINLVLTASCASFYGCLIGVKLICKNQLKKPLSNRTAFPSNGHLQVNKKLLFTSFHGSLPQLQ